MEFVTDGMLGRLTRWLRLLGCDVKYLRDSSDTVVLEITKEDKRILLTRDLELHKRAVKQNIKSCLVKTGTDPEKLATLAKLFNIKIEINPIVSRCPICNSLIHSIDKMKVKDRVYPGTFKKHNMFWECMSCRKIYWYGTHWKKINETIYETMKLLKN